MPRLDFCHERQAWFKRCSCCNVETIGNADLKESLKIIESMFSPSNGEAQAWDGMQSRCWICNSAKRRELGITRQQLEDMMARQDSKCAICALDISILRTAPPYQKANVDHDEASGEIRGLLCGNCNRGIGLFLYQSNLLCTAADYCNHHAKIIRLRGV